MEYQHWHGDGDLESLLEDGRYAEALPVLEILAHEQGLNAWATVLQAFCLASLGREDEAFRAAQTAVEADPESAFANWCFGLFLCDRNRLDQALEAATTATSLDPHDPEPHALAAKVHAKRENWASSRECAERGLSIDPQNESCLALRALALRQTDSGVDWAEAVRSLVASNPANSWARAAQGWAELERGEATSAQTHFEQALALDPTDEWARAGMIESLKAANPIYAAVLRLFLWIDRLPRRQKWLYFLAGWFTYRILRETVERNPMLGLVAYPVMAVWVLFLLMSWISEPLSDFVIRRTSEGKRLIRGERRIAANAVALVLFAGLSAALWATVSGTDRSFFVALALGFLVIPIAATFQCSPGWPRKTMVLYTSFPVLCILGALVAPIGPAGILAILAVVLSALGSWLGTYLRGRLPVR